MAALSIGAPKFIFHFHTLAPSSRLVTLYQIRRRFLSSKQTIHPKDSWNLGIWKHDLPVNALCHKNVIVLNLRYFSIGEV